jgi:anti-sigma B factor antagonist
MTLAGHLRVWIEDRPPLLELRLAGELDLGTAPQLKQAVDAYARTGQTLVIDMREVEFVDSMGLAALVRVRHRALSRGAKLQLVRPAESAWSVFALTGLDRVFEWVEGDDVREDVSSPRGARPPARAAPRASAARSPAAP